MLCPGGSTIPMDLLVVCCFQLLHVVVLPCLAVERFLDHSFLYFKNNVVSNEGPTSGDTTCRALHWIPFVVVLEVEELHCCVVGDIQSLAWEKQAAGCDDPKWPNFVNEEVKAKLPLKWIKSLASLGFHSVGAVAGSVSVCVCVCVCLSLSLSLCEFEA